MTPSRCSQLVIHGVLLFLAAVTFFPFLFVVNGSFRSNEEIYDSFFGFPSALKHMVTGEPSEIAIKTGEPPAKTLSKGYKLGWSVLRRYTLNSIIVSVSTAVMVVVVGSATAYVLSRYRFFGSKVIFAVILSTMMVPGILTLVPTYLLVRGLGLLDTRWVLILPYAAGGQVFAIFVFRSFFAGLPEELFESARIDGAGHFSIYCNIVLPLSLPVISVVAVMNILATWNNFLWPFVTISKDELQVVSSGLYVMVATQVGQNLSTRCAGYVLASIPLLVLFLYATKPFVRGVTSGALKA